MVVTVAHRQLLPPAVLALAPRVAPASDRRSPLAEVQMAPLDKRGLALPAPGREDLCKRRSRAACHPVLPPDPR